MRNLFEDLGDWGGVSILTWPRPESRNTVMSTEPFWYAVRRGEGNGPGFIMGSKLKTHTCSMHHNDHNIHGEIHINDL
jgi:hypothetical protein